MTQAKSSQRKGYQDSIGIENYNGKYRLNLARKHTRVFFPEEKSNKRISTGLTVCPENQGKVEQTAWAIHYDILSGNFDATLVKYGLVRLSVVQPSKPKQLSILEIYDRYCEARKGTIAITTFEIHFKGSYRKAIAETIEAIGFDALAIRNYLLEHRAKNVVRECLRHLSKAHQLAMKHGYALSNPFDGMAEEIKSNKGKGKAAINDDDENEDSDTRAFTVEEMNAIIEAFESSSRKQHLAPFIKFLFWTGCRTGEAIALKWRDIKWDNELIVFRRSYSHELGIFKGTKTGVIRYFPMPKNGQLWNLLKSLPERELDDVVFVSKQGKIIRNPIVRRVWHGDRHCNQLGVIPELIEQGKVSQYLKLYATRHTFISHQVNIHKIPITTVAQWVGNGAMVANNNYLDRDRMTVPGYSEPPKEETPVAESNQMMINFVAGLTPEQREQFKMLLW